MSCAVLPCSFLGGAAGFSLYIATFETPMLTLGGEGPCACKGRILLYAVDGQANVIGGYPLQSVSEKDFTPYSRACEFLGWPKVLGFYY
jgi:hypothetical protein